MHVGPGSLSLTLGLSGTLMHTEHDAVADTSAATGVAIIHSQDIGFGELSLGAEYGVRDGIGIEARVPLRLIDTSIQYLDRATLAAVELAAPNIHHRTERLVRPADPWLLGHFSLVREAWAFDFRAGLSLPVGRTEEDPFVLGDRGLRHQHLQFGTGTFNPILGANAGRTFSSWSLGAFVLTQQVLYANRKGFEAGDRYAAGVTAASQLGTEAWTFRIGPELQAETAERWSGTVHTDDGNQGRFDALGMAGAAVALGKGLFATAAVRARLYTHVVGGQLEYPAVVDLGLGWVSGRE